jgi:hypothetical protein
MDANTRFLFDLQGYCVIPDAMSAEQLARANAAVDANMHSIQRRGSAEAGEGQGLLSGKSPALVRDQGRGDISGAMTWPSPHGAIFRELVHRRLTPSPVLLVSSAAAPLRADR